VTDAEPIVYHPGVEVAVGEKVTEAEAVTVGVSAIGLKGGVTGEQPEPTKPIKAIETNASVKEQNRVIRNLPG
jgi:hypothetical protein